MSTCAGSCITRSSITISGRLIRWTPNVSESRPTCPWDRSDPQILDWAERAGRILLSFDRNTMPDYLARHLAEGRHSPGVFIIRLPITIPEIINTLVLYSYASDADEWRDRLEYIP